MGRAQMKWHEMAEAPPNSRHCPAVRGFVAALPAGARVYWALLWKEEFSREDIVCSRNLGAGAWVPFGAPSTWT